jgi:sulfur-carrier protein
MIRVILPAHLRALIRENGELRVDAGTTPTLCSVIDELEQRYPMLCGTLRDHVTKKRRAFVRFYACERDLSHESPNAALPQAVINGAEPLLFVGAMAGG